MKNLVTIIFVLGLSLSIFGQAEYEKAVKSALSEFDSSKTLDEMKAIAAKFERIAAAEPGQWLPPYYAGFINCLLAFKTQDATQIKMHTDLAQKFVDAALKISPQESEIHTLQGMVYQAIIGIDPMNNGMAYGSKAAASFETAKSLNPANPRPYYLQGLSVMYTPEQFGGGKKNALGIFAKANELFSVFVPVSDISPNWGKEDCAAQLEACNKN